MKVDFYLMKGILENLLDYLGLHNRYQFEVGEISSLHPGVSCNILLDRERIGVLGKVHPSVSKDEVYVCEISLNALMKKIKPLKYKEASKYPGISKDLAFIVDKNTTSDEISSIMKKAGGRLLLKH